MFGFLFRFEVKQHLKKTFTWIFLALMVVQGSYYMHHSGEYYSADKTYANAPAIVYTVLAAMGYLGFVVAAIFGGMVLGKDVDYKTASILYTTRVQEKTFFLARYLGSFSVLALLYAGYVIGIVLYSYLPIPNLGPFSWIDLLRGTVLLFLPNALVIYTLCFSISVIFRNNKLAYGIALLCMLLMIFAETTFESNQYTVLADPTAFSVLHHMLDHLSPAEKNNFSPAFSGLLLQNRIIWMSLTGLLFLLAARSFSFRTFGVRNEYDKKSVVEKNTTPVAAAFTGKLISAVQRFSLLSDWRKVFSLSWLEYKTVTRPAGFKIFLFLLLVIYVGYIAVWQQEYYSAAPTLPVTVEITSVTLPLAFYVLLFLIINTTELLFKSQSSGFWQIGDALPVPSWVSILSKIIAMTGVALAILLSFVVFGVLIQVAKGYYYFEWSVYFNDLFIRWLPKYLAYILLTVFVAGITASRFATHWITILFLIFSVILHETEVIEQDRLNYSFSPGSGANTDMNGNGIFTLAHQWYMLQWLSLGLSFVMIANWVWQRGTATNFLKRLQKARPQKQLVPLVLFLVGIAGFLFGARKIYQTVNVANRYQTNEESRAESADYEKTYSKYSQSPQPVTSNLDLQLDFFPENRKLNYKASLSIENRTALPIDTLHLEWMDFSTIRSVKMTGYQLSVVKEDLDLRHTSYLLNKPLSPGEKTDITFTGDLQYDGFTNSDPQKELTFNGSFLPYDIIPHFGYDDRRELKENQYRARYDLTKLPNRLPDTTNVLARQQLFASTQATRLDYTLHISTAADQKIVAPGKTEKEWVEKGRRHYTFRSEGGQLADFHLISANYTVQKSAVTIDGKTIGIELYHHPAHYYNANRLLTTAKKALIALSKTAGTYPYSTLRIAERPRYDEALYAYGNVIVLPENHAWIADVRKQEDLDYLNFVVTKLVAQQFFQQANMSRTQGYPLVTRSVPYYLALVQLEKENGETAVKNHLQKSNDQYLKGRAKETNDEPSLLKSDADASYVYDEKGGAELYKLAKRIGFDKVNQVISDFLANAKSTTAPITVYQFYNNLLHAVPDNDKALVRQRFESID